MFLWVIFFSQLDGCGLSLKPIKTWAWMEGSLRRRKEIWKIRRWFFFWINGLFYCKFCHFLLHFSIFVLLLFGSFTYCLRYSNLSPIFDRNTQIQISHTLTSRWKLAGSSLERYQNIQFMMWIHKANTFEI